MIPQVIALVVLGILSFGGSSYQLETYTYYQMNLEWIPEDKDRLTCDICGTEDCVILENHSIQCWAWYTQERWKEGAE